jgi:hypothetical protein
MEIFAAAKYKELYSDFITPLGNGVITSLLPFPYSGLWFGKSFHKHISGDS